jgi:membrane-associated protease RseP (regulator of RpoE activity)
MLIVLSLIIFLPLYLLVVMAGFPLTVLHELAHLVVGRKLGFQPESMSFGAVGKSRTMRICGFPISIRPLLLLGGRVDFYGEDLSTGDVPPHLRDVAFCCMPVWKQGAVAAAGPIASVLGSIFVLAYVQYRDLGVPPETRSLVVLAGSISHALDWMSWFLIKPGAHFCVSVDGLIQSLLELGPAEIALIAAGNHLAVATANTLSIKKPSGQPIKTDGYYIWRWLHSRKSA